MAICQLRAASCIVLPLKTGLAVHFWATFPGRSRGQPWVNLLFSPFLLHFGRSAKGWFSLLESMADTFAQLGAGVLHNSPWCRHRLLRPALRYTSLHAQHCTIPPPHTLSLHNSSTPPLLESKTLHFTIYLSPGARLGHRQKRGGEAEHRGWQW